MNDLLQRRGIVKISDDLIRKEPEKVLAILKDILIVRLDNDFITRSLTYSGYSERFDILEDGEITPNYIADIQISPKKIEVTWRREKEYSEQSVKAMLQELKQEVIKGREY